ncbi:MAG: PAS domain-containing sensor histidine kinase, partial [Salaquimonas sp.]
ATISMASELDRERRLYSLDRTGFNEMLNLQTRGRGMISAQLVREDGEVVVSAKVNESLDLPKVPAESLEAAKTGDMIFIPRGRTNIVGAVMKMRSLPNVYLYTIRPLRDDVLKSLLQMEENTNEYNDLEKSRLPVQLTFAVLYLAMALMILLAAIWMGISVADRFVRPIRRLINAADEVSAGNLDINVDTKHTEGDFKNLGDTFNTMTTQLKQQRTQLLQANRNIDERARFTEAVLSGVTAAVIGVDETGKVSIANSTTRSILGAEVAKDMQIETVLPELGKVLANARQSGKANYREQITTMIEGQSRTLNAQVTQEREGVSDHSFVITIDDITDLVVAQRSSAWSDVARRIAHEIKNPLTPIQLSAERIKKRYRKYITDDTDVFDQCTETIIRQVGDIGRMVDEFSSFARMPKPEMTKGDIAKTIQESMFTQKVANPHIAYVLDLKAETHIAKFDERLMSQALINIIKNAGEAIDGKDKGEHAKTKGKVLVHTWLDSGTIVIDVIDNGKGLPEEDRQKLLEPYMTTRQKGTGLGLAIVRKIMEDHGGTIELMDAPSVADGGQGAMMRLRIPQLATDAEQAGIKKVIAKGDQGRLGTKSENNEEKEATS